MSNIWTHEFRGSMIITQLKQCCDMLELLRLACCNQNKIIDTENVVVDQVYYRGAIAYCVWYMGTGGALAGGRWCGNYMKFDYFKEGVSAQLVLDSMDQIEGYSPQMNYNSLNMDSILGVSVEEPSPEPPAPLVG